MRDKAGMTDALLASSAHSASPCLFLCTFIPFFILSPSLCLFARGVFPLIFCLLLLSLATASFSRQLLSNPLSPRSCISPFDPPLCLQPTFMQATEYSCKQTSPSAVTHG